MSTPDTQPQHETEDEQNGDENTPPDRVCLGVRVPGRIKRAFAEAIEAEYGRTQAHAGHELGREIRAFLGEGELAGLLSAVDDLADPHLPEDYDDSRLEKPTDWRDPKLVNYRIREDTKAELERRFENSDSSLPRIVAAIMLRYVNDRGLVGRVRKKAEDAADCLDTDEIEERATGAKQRRKGAICDHLGDGPFTLDDFSDAVDTAADGISPGRHAREEYLPGVLERKDVAPHPNNNSLFLPTDRGVIPDYPDPANLPYEVMDEQEKKTAIKAAAFRKAKNNCSGKFAGRGKLTISEAKSQALGARGLTNDTVRGLMHDIANTAPDDGISYKRRGGGALQVDLDDARMYDVDHEHALGIIGELPELEDEEDGADEPDTEEVDAEPTPDPSATAEADTPAVADGGANGHVGAYSDDDDD